ncbi:MAG: GNAT family N-acetyltransferase [Clostridiaceae bacterium]|nr:GNAT family N-acetyltransferase [Clostridiaceae bacterium]
MIDILEIKYAAEGLTKGELDDIWDIMCDCNREFVPPLSSRNSPTQSNLLTGRDDTQTDVDDKPYVYFEEIRKQHFILAEIEGKVIGFLTFKTDHMCDALQDFGVSNYITTVCIDKKYRKQGILSRLYEHMENKLPDSIHCSKVSTRTWSQNDAHAGFLLKRGYTLLKTLPDDRGPGIDTLYFGAKLK